LLGKHFLPSSHLSKIAETKNNSKDLKFKEAQKERKGVSCKEEVGRRS
jgi:hypothetical protein